MVDRFKSAASPDQVPYYFFFDSLQTAADNGAAAYRAILSQILQKNSANAKLIDMFRFSMYFATDGQPTASPGAAGDLLELCLQLPDLEESVLVIDGLDECEKAEGDLIKRLKNLKLKTRVKMVILGRSSVQSLLKGMPDLIELHVGGLNFDDIHLFLRRELGTAIDDELLPSSLDIEDSAVKLSRRADGMFLWARLMVTYLKSPGLLVSERLEAISDIDMPEGLERMYERILKHMAKSGKASLRLANHIFMCLLYSQRQMTSEELEDCVVSRKRGGIDEPSRTMPNFIDTVLSVCGGFVEHCMFVPETGVILKSSFRFIHVSVKDYFRTEPQRKTDGLAVLKDVILISPPLAAHARLATQLLEYVVFALPKSKIETFEPLKAKLLSMYPLSQYVATKWPDHAVATNGSQVDVQQAYEQEPSVYADFISALCQLLSRPKAVSAWIQSCYIFHHRPPSTTLLQWAAVCSRDDFPWRKHFHQVMDIIPDIQNLAIYLREANSSWGSHLQNNPSCIWEEVSAFNPSPFIEKPRGITVERLVSPKPMENLTETPIHKISRLMPDGKLDYVLSVFPTKYGYQLDQSSFTVD